MRAVTRRMPAGRLRDALVYWFGRRDGVGMVELPGGGRLEVPLDDGAMRLLDYSGEYERDLQDVARMVLRAGDTAIDVGANFGMHTLLFAGLVGPTGRVLAFEPTPVAASALRRNVAISGWEDRVAIHEMILSDTAGSKALHASGGIASTSSVLDLPWLADAATIEVPSVRLDAIEEATRGPVKLLKVDVEGYEPQVLRGAAGLFDVPTRPTWVAAEFSSFAPTDAFEWLAGRGYRAHRWAQHKLVPVSAVPVLEGRTVENLYFRAS
jgi:FkbM family methyltransferase